MISWVMSLYIFSGLLMLLGVYFTIRYRPYCTLKSPERELAMKLHRKKLLDEQMTEKESYKCDDYLMQTKKYSIGDFVLFISILLHVFIFAGNGWFNLSLLYYLSIVCMTVIITVKNIYLPFCFQNFPANTLWSLKDEYLESLNVYHKKNHGIQLDESSLKTFKTESNILKSEESALKMFLFYRYSINFGVVLHLVLDVWFGLNGSLIIN